MKHETFTLTTKDFAILEVMHDRCPAGDPLAHILKRKIDGATVVFRDDAPTNVATLNSRVRFSMSGGEPRTGIVSDGAPLAGGEFAAPITTALGLALVGLAEGQSFTYADGDGNLQSVRLEAVLRQPGAAPRPQQDEAAQPQAGERRRPELRVISGGYDGTPAPAPAVRIIGRTPPDDPGPSAA